MNTPPTQVLDATLVASFADRADGSAFEQLVARHAALVFSVCRSVLGRHHDAEDAAQATFLTLARRAASLRDHPSIAGWLHRVAWHIATRARAARALRDARERSAAAVESAPPDGHRSDDRVMHELIADLPEKLRLPIVLHHLEGWSEAETAAVLGVRLGTVSGWLHRGRKRLKDRIERLGMAPAFALAPGALWSRADAAPAELVTAIGKLAVAGHAAPRPLVIGLSNAALQMLRGLVIRRWLLIAALVGLPLLIGGAAALIATSHRAAGLVAVADGWIQGTVTGPSGGPVRGGHVYVYLSASAAAARSGGVAHVRTDDAGKFEIRKLPPAERYYILVGIPCAGDPPPAEQFLTDRQSSAETQVQHLPFRAN